MCHYRTDDLERREEELRRQAAELLKRADAIRGQRQADAEQTEQMRQRVKETEFV